MFEHVNVCFGGCILGLNICGYGVCVCVVVSCNIKKFHYQTSGITTFCSFFWLTKMWRKNLIKYSNHFMIFDVLKIFFIFSLSLYKLFLVSSVFHENCYSMFSKGKTTKRYWQPILYKYLFGVFDGFSVVSLLFLFFDVVTKFKRFVQRTTARNSQCLSTTPLFDS